MPNPTPLNDEALCARYGVAIYRAEELPNAPMEDRGKFVVTTLSEDFPDAPRIPALDTRVEAMTTAINVFGLSVLYAAEQQVGHALPRRCMSN